jgi:hypothetical protein
MLWTVAALAAGCAATSPPAPPSVAEAPQPVPESAAPAIPDLRGTWVLVRHIDLKNGRIANTLSFFRVTGEAGQQQIATINLTPQGTVKEAWLAANKAARAWEPTAAEKRELAAQIRAAGSKAVLPPGGVRITTPDKYEVSAPVTEEAKDSLFSLHASGGGMNMLAAGGMYFVHRVEPQHLSGRFAAGALAAAAVPVPVAIGGTFDMWELGE